MRPAGGPPLKVRSALAALLALALTSCSRNSIGHAGSNAWTTHGVLRIAGRQQPDNLNLLLGTQTVDTDLSMFWAGYLFDWSDANELIPDLAVRVPTPANGDISRDGLRVTYHLRRGVKWQDGAPFTADDVVYTWQQIMNPRNLTVTRLGYDVIASIAKSDPYTIDVRLKHPYAPFVNSFLTMANHPYLVLPKHLLAKYPDLNHAEYNSLPVGTGPFRVERYERGSQITFVANPLYWRGPPKLRRVEFRIVENDATILTLLQSHAIDVYYRAPESAIANLRGIPGTRVVISPFTRFADLGLNAANPALADVRVRRALAFATDRAALVQNVTHGIAMPAIGDQPPFSWAFEPHVARYPFDPARAAALLDAAGWRMGADGIRQKNGRRLELELVSFTGSSTVESAEVAIQAQWRRSGIDVAIKNFSSAQLYATLGAGGVEQSGKFDAIFENWANGVDPDDSLLFRCDMAPPNGWNVYHFCNARYDAASREELSSSDPAARRRAFSTQQRIVAEELPIVVLWYQQQLDVINSDLRGYRPAHAVTPFWNTWEWSI